MATSKTRQRKLERDRYERKMVRRAQQQRRSRRVKAGFGAVLVLAVLGAGTAWQLGAFENLFSGGGEDELAIADDECVWEEAPDPERADVGTPPADPPTEGARTATVDLDAGDAGSGEVEVELNLVDEPCGAASLEHLAVAGFYDDTTCHELTAEGALRCGDPDGTSLGGPSYAFYGENFPYPSLDEQDGEDGDEVGPQPEEEPAQEVLYPAGTVALADVDGQHGSQLLLFHQDFATEGPIWPIVGTVTGGLDLLEEIGVAGVTEDEPPGPPAEEVRIRSLSVADPEAAAGAPDES